MGKKFYVAVDFDGTIVDHRFPDIGDSVPGAFEFLKKFQDSGATLILWTMRSDGQDAGNVLTQAIEYCENRGVVFDFVNENPQPWTTSQKAYAHVYIDDLAFGCPLRENPRMGGKPYVHWSKIGPAILDIILERLHQLGCE